MPSHLKVNTAENLSNESLSESQSLKNKNRRYFTPCGPYDLSSSPRHTVSPNEEHRAFNARTDSLYHINARHINVNTSNHDFVVTGTAATTSKHSIRLSGSSLVSTLVKCGSKQLSKGTKFVPHSPTSSVILHEPTHGRLSPVTQLKPESLPLILHRNPSQKSSTECDLNIKGYSLSSDKVPRIKKLPKTSYKKMPTPACPTRDILRRRAGTTGFTARVAPFAGNKTHPLPAPGAKCSTRSTPIFNQGNKTSTETRPSTLKENTGLSIGTILNNISSGNLISR